MHPRRSGAAELRRTVIMGDGAQEVFEDSAISEEIARWLVRNGAVAAEVHGVLRTVIAEHPGDPVECGIQLLQRRVLHRQQWVAAAAAVSGLEIWEGDAADPQTHGCARDWCTRFHTTPLRVTDTELLLLTADPRAGRRRRALAEWTPEDPKLPVRWVLTDPFTVQAMISAAFRAGSQLAALVAQGADGAPQAVVELVEMLIAQAVRDRASDLHIDPGREHSLVRARVDGRLIDLVSLPLGSHAPIVSRIKVLAQMDIVERRIPQDGTFSMEVDGRHLDIRVASLPTVRGEKVVLRLLPGELAVASLEELGMDTATLSRYRTVLQARDGVVLCAGPTGAGKTTTLIASLAVINDPSLHIITIEDPVEYLVAGATQVQTNPRAGLGFANGLRALLRQDPDVVLVGEIRDLETAAIAVQASLTGHLVLSSIHGTDAVTGLYRLIDMGVAPYLVASAVRAVVAQRLVRLRCVACGGKAPQQARCAQCARSGYLGRIAVYEVLVMTASIREGLRAGIPTAQLREQVRAEGMTSMAEQAMALVAEGRCDVDEVRAMFPDDPAVVEGVVDGS